MTVNDPLRPTVNVALFALVIEAGEDVIPDPRA